MANGKCYWHGGPSRDGGAPDGNANALTHGLYTNSLTPDERELWSQIEVNSVDDEIRLTKFKLARVETAISRLEAGEDVDFHLFERRTEASTEGNATSRRASEVRRRPDWYAHRISLLRTLARLLSTKTQMVQAGLMTDTSSEEEARSIQTYLEELNKATVTNEGD